MTYLRDAPDNTIIRRIPADLATVPFHTVEPRWNRPVIVYWTRLTDIIIVQPPKRRRAPHNPLPDRTVAALWRPDATKAELWKA